MTVFVLLRIKFFLLKHVFTLPFGSRKIIKAFINVAEVLDTQKIQRDKINKEY